MEGTKLKKIFLCIVILFASCKKESTNEPQNNPQPPYTLLYGQVVTVKSLNLELGFRDVTDDSRCPKGVICVWEGIAHSRIWIKSPATDTIFIAASILGYCERNDTTRHIAVDTSGFRITLMQLDPYPVHATTHPKSDYSAMINIIKR